MYAIVKTGGKQYRVEKGQTLLVERLPDEAGATSRSSRSSSAPTTSSSTPTTSRRCTVDAKVVEHLRGPKLRVFKFKPKRGYASAPGHRQELTRIEVTDIVGPGEHEDETARRPSRWHTRRASAPPATAATRTPSASA